MWDNGYPVFYTYKEMEKKYRKHEISFKELMLYKNRPDKLPVKRYESYGPSTASATI